MLPLMIIYYVIVQPVVKVFNWITGRKTEQQQEPDEKGRDTTPGDDVAKAKSVEEGTSTQSTQVST